MANGTAARKPPSRPSPAGKTWRSACAPMGRPTAGSSNTSGLGSRRPSPTPPQRGGEDLEPRPGGEGKILSPPRRGGEDLEPRPGGEGKILRPSPEIPPPPPAPPDAAIADLPLEKLSVDAGRAMAGALQIAIDAQAYLGTEHVLLGVLGQESSVGAIALQSLGVTPAYVTARLPPGKGPITARTPILTTRVANALMQSILGSADAPVIDSRVLVDAVIASDGVGGGDPGRR